MKITRIIEKQMIVSINNEKKTVRDGTTLTELLLGEKIISDAGNL